MRTVTITKHYLETPIGEVELSFEPENDPTIVVAPNGNVIVGYLVQDSDCENPLEDCDGMGEIHHHPRSRYGSRDSDYFNILGLDGDGAPRIDEDKLQARWYDKVLALPDALFSFPEGYADEAWPDAPVYSSDGEPVSYQYKLKTLLADENAVGNYALSEQCRYAWRDHISDALRELLVNRLEADALPDWSYEREVEACREPGDPDAILLDLYDHGGVAYSVSGNGMNCRWDTSRGESVWIPDACLRSELEAITDPQERYAKACEYAKQACETYTSWCNGDCWGVVVQTHDSEGALLDDDACWGYIGSEWAEKELAEQVAWALKHNDREAA